MADFVPYEDIVTILFGPDPQKKLNTFFKNLSEQTIAQFYAMQSKIMQSMRDQLNAMGNEINATSIKTQSAIAGQIEQVKKLKTAEQERLSQIEKLAQASSKEALEIEKIKQATAQAVQERRREAKIMNEQEGSYKRMSLELQKNIDKYKSLSKSQRESSQVGGQLLKTIQGQQVALKKMDGDMGNFQRNVGNYNGAVGKAKTIMLGWLAAIGGVWGALRAGRAVIEAADSTSDKFAITIGKAKTAFDYFLKSLSTGDFSNFFTNMRRAIEAGAEYAKKLDEIEDRNRALTIAESELNVKRQADLKILRDRTKSIDEQIAAGERILANEDKLAKLRVDIANQAKNARIDSFKALDITEETVIANLKEYESNKGIIEQADAYNEKLKLRQQLAQIYANTTIPQTEKEKQQFKDLNDQIANTDKSVVAFAQLRSRYTKLSAKELDELVKLYVDLNNATASYDENTQRASARLSSLLAENGKRQDKALDDKKEEIVLQGTINQLKQRQAEIEKEIPSLDLNTASGMARIAGLQAEYDRTKKLIEQFENLGKMVKLVGIEGGVTPTNPIKAKVPVEVELVTPQDTTTIWETFLNTLGLNEQEFQELSGMLTDSLKSLFSAWNDLITTQAENELKEHDRTLEGLKTRLDKEQKLKEDGKANDYDMLVDQIAKEERLQADALKKYKSAQKQQAVIDEISTMSQLGLAAAEIYGQNAKTGPYGIIAGIALSLSMLASFMSLKAKLSAISKNNSYAEGTEYVQGPGTETSDSVPSRLSKGERVVKASINKQLDGIDNDRLPEIYRFYKYNYLRGSGAVQVQSTREVIKELRMGRNVSEQMLTTLKKTATVKELSENKVLLIWPNGNTQIITYRP